MAFMGGNFDLSQLLPLLQQMQQQGMPQGQPQQAPQQAPQQPQGQQPFQMPSLMQTNPLPSGPAANAFLDRFGPYRLQSFDAMRMAPQITGGGMGLFEPKGLKASGLLDDPKPRGLSAARPERRGGDGGGR